MLKYGITTIEGSYGIIDVFDDKEAAINAAWDYVTEDKLIDDTTVGYYVVETPDGDEIGEIVEVCR